MPLLDLIGLLSRSTLYSLAPDSLAYFALTSEGEWFLLSQHGPDQICVQEVRFSGPEAMRTLERIDLQEGRGNVAI